MGRQLHLKWNSRETVTSERRFPANEEEARAHLKKLGLADKYRAVYMRGYWHLYPLTWKDGTPIEDPK